MDHHNIIKYQKGGRGNDEDIELKVKTEMKPEFRSGSTCREKLPQKLDPDTMDHDNKPKIEVDGIRDDVWIEVKTEYHPIELNPKLESDFTFSKHVSTELETKMQVKQEINTTGGEFDIHKEENIIEKSSNPASCLSPRFLTNSNIKKIVILKKNPKDKKYKCSHCYQYFPCKSNLVEHLRKHTGEKPYQCSLCDKYFSIKTNLVNHERMHTRENPYQLSFSDKRFKQNANLIVHKKTHSGEKPYQCSHCDRCFSRKMDIVSHYRTHTGEKPYQCSFCEKSFSISAHLVYHIRTHTGEKPYQCSRCDICFSFKYTLARHQRICTGIKSYNCSHCGKSFFQETHLDRHQKIAWQCGGQTFLMSRQKTMI